MIVSFDIEPAGDLTPVMVAHNIGNSIGLPFQVLSMGCDDESVQLEIEISKEDIITDDVIKEPFNKEE